ncbi:A disintegrin and metalloproteinase with thrombospondin motifs 16-like isoform X2 [Ornithodoros turicata]
MAPLDFCQSTEHCAAGAAAMRSAVSATLALCLLLCLGHFLDRCDATSSYTASPRLQFQPNHFYDVARKMEKLLTVGTDHSDAKYDVFEPHFETPPSHQRRRRRRRRRRHPPDAELGVEVQAFGQNLRLALEHTRALLSRDFQLLEVGTSGKRRRRAATNMQADADCFYQGYVRGIPRSRVALSICNGLRGLIEVPNASYLVYPLPPERQGANSTHQPHIIVQQDQRERRFCGHYGKTHENSNTERYPPVYNSRQRRRARRRVHRDTKAVIETAVFVDQALYTAMARAFPVNTDQELVTFVLTILNAVQMLFKHDSLGRNIDITVVELEILKLQPKDLVPSENIDTYLTNFCVWQHHRRKSSILGSSRWDHALLLSGINMFVVDEKGMRKRHVVGLAPVSGMCNSLNSCTISEGTSFQSVYVASHEMGHSLGMEHDGKQDGNPCDVDNYVMSPTLGAGKTTWSPCSRQYMEKFLRSQAAHCVFKQGSPVNLLGRTTQRLPGEQFTPDQQCSLRFGTTSRHSPHQPLEEMCRMLRCDTNRDLTPVSYAAHPALEGTPCGRSKWCRGGKCVSKQELERRSREPPIHGGWSSWTAFGPCRSDCVIRGDFASVGVRVSRRRCDDPRPQNGGKYCEGSDKRVQICDASQVCPASRPKQVLEDFMLSICRQASLRDNTIEPLGTQFPSRDNSHSCYVWCHKQNGGYMTHGWRIPDGTPCWTYGQRGNRYCVDGECQGFDCNGRSTEDEFLEECVRTSAAMVRAPAGWGPWHTVSECRHSCLLGGTGFQLVARECNSIPRCRGKRETFKLCDSTAKCSNMISADQYATKVCGKYRRKYPSLLSGRGRQLPPQPGNEHVSCVVACQDRVWRDTHYQMDVFEEGRFPFGTDCSGGDGTAFCVGGVCQKFSKEGIPLEDATASNRISGRLQRSRRSRAILPEDVPRADMPLQPLVEPDLPYWWLQSNDTWARVRPFFWKVLLSDCSAPCGGGLCNVTVNCQVDGKEVDKALCDPRLRPPIDSGSSPCNTHPCTGSWHVEPWGPCSQSCGSHGFRHRRVVCIQPMGQSIFSLVHDPNCPLPEPPRIEKCVMPPCPTK